MDKGADIDIKPPKDYFKKDFSELTGDINTTWESLVKTSEKQVENIKNKPKTPKSETHGDKNKDKKTQVLEASSRRDYWGKIAKMLNVLKPASKSTEVNISPIFR